LIPANIEKAFDQIDLGLSDILETGAFPIIVGGDRGHLGTRLTRAEREQAERERDRAAGSLKSELAAARGTCADHSGSSGLDLREP
jgi:hypothetical protein